MCRSSWFVTLFLVIIFADAEHARDVAETVSEHFAAGDGKEITVMTLNTFLLPIPRAPQIEARARMLSQWFRALPTSHIPDVLVLNEMWHGNCIKHLCHTDFKADNMLWGTGADRVTKCADDSPFGAVTPVANDRTFPVPISSGVIILAKKGVELEWRPDWDYEYQSSVGSDALARKGAQLVKVTLPQHKGMYYVVGTHLQAGSKVPHVRKQQLNEMVAFLEDKVPADSTVIVAGDFNVELEEISSLMRALTRNGTSVEPAGFTATGFWAYNDPPLNATGSASNQFKNERQREKRLDWVVPVAMNTDQRVASSWMSMQYQYVAIRSPKCYAAQTKYAKQYMSDIADHYAVLAHLRDEPYGTRGWATKEVLVLPNPRCSVEIPSDDEIQEEGLSLLTRMCLILASLVVFVICTVCSCCVVCRAKREKLFQNGPKDVFFPKKLLEDYGTVYAE